MWFEQGLSQAWASPAYRAVVVAIAVSTLLLLALVAVLVVQTFRRRSRRRRRRHLFEQLQEVLEAGQTPLADWVREQGVRANRVLESVLVQLAVQGHRDQVRQAWDELGFDEKERSALKKGPTGRRLKAARRLVVLGDASDREAVVEGVRHEDDRRFRIVALHLLARIGNTSDVVAALKGVEIERRVMEQPFYSAFRSMDRQQLEELIHTDLSEVGQRVRWVLFDVAARQMIDGVDLRIRKMAKSDELERRIAAARIAGALGKDEGRSILRELLDDNNWEVRAQAVKGLGMVGEREDAPLLREIFISDDYWVRQNARWSLVQLEADQSAELEPQQAHPVQVVPSARQ